MTNLFRAPPKSVPRSFFPGHSENPTASSSNQPQAADIPVPTSTVEDDDNETIDTNEQIQNLFLMKKM